MQGLKYKTPISPPGNPISVTPVINPFPLQMPVIESVRSLIKGNDKSTTTSDSYDHIQLKANL